MLRRHTRSAVQQFARQLATPATELPNVAADASAGPSTPASTENEPDPPTRPHLGIPVNPNHGLWAFFRKKVDDAGVEKHETVEPPNVLIDGSGRSWSAPELRLKSFKDLHTLWYIVLRERNLLATQKEEARRMGVEVHILKNVSDKVYQCRKTMARIKYVLNERRHAFEGAVRMHTEWRTREFENARAQEQQKNLEEKLALAEADQKRARQEQEQEQELMRQKVVTTSQARKQDWASPAARLAASAIFKADKFAPSPPPRP